MIKSSVCALIVGLASFCDHIASSDLENLPDNWLRLGVTSSGYDHEPNLSATGQFQDMSHDGQVDEQSFEPSAEKSSKSQAASQSQDDLTTSEMGSRFVASSSSTSVEGKASSIVNKYNAGWYNTAEKSEHDVLRRMLKGPWGFSDHADGDARTLRHMRENIAKEDAYHLLHGTDASIKEQIINRTIPFRKRPENAQRMAWKKILLNAGMSDATAQGHLSRCIAEAANTGEPVEDILRRKIDGFTPKKTRVSNAMKAEWAQKRKEEAKEAKKAARLANKNIKE